MIFAFSMGAFASIHSKWVAGDLIFYDGTTNIFTIRDDTDGVKIYDDLNLTFGTGNDATIEYDEADTNKLIVTCSNGFTVSGAWAVTVAAPTTAIDAVYGYITASAEWTSGNMVGVRGRVVVSGTNNYVSATGVWAGLDFSTSTGSGSGLTCGLNAEVSSNNSTVPNSIIYIQSLPGSSANFSDVPYLVFSETRGGVLGTGSRYLFEVGHAAARTIPTIGTGELFYNHTLQIAVNESAGSRTNFFIPLSTIEGTYTTEYLIDVTVAGGTAIDIGTSVTGINFSGTYSTAAIAIGTVGKITFHDAQINMYAADDGDLVINADATLIVTCPIVDIVATTSLTHKYDDTNKVTQTVSSSGTVLVDVTGASTGSYEIQTDDGTIVLDAETFVNIDIDTTNQYIFGPDGIDMNANNFTEVGTYAGTGAITIDPGAGGTFLDFVLETTWVSGTLINIDYASSTTLSDHTIVMLVDLTNGTVLTSKNVTAYEVKLPAFSQTSDSTTTLIGFNLSTAGALAQSSAAGAIVWKGINIQLPETTTAVGTVTAHGIYLTAGTLNSGTQNVMVVSGIFTTGIDFSAATMSGNDIVLQNSATITNGEAGTLTITEPLIEFVGAVTGDTTLAVTSTNATAAGVNAILGENVAGEIWTSGNQVGVRGRTTITGVNNYISATGVWAGLVFTDATGTGTGLMCALNAEVSSNNATVPNAVVYIQSLPGADSDFSNTPYLVFSETRGGGTETGSRYLFEVGHQHATTIPTIGTGELFYHDTLQIAVNESEGDRTNFFIPLSSVEGSFTYDYFIKPNAAGGADSDNGLLIGVGTSEDPATTAVASKNFLEFRTQSTATSGDGRGLYIRYELCPETSTTGSGEAVRGLAMSDKIAANLTGVSGAVGFVDGVGSITGSSSGMTGTMMINTAGQTTGWLYGVVAQMHFAGAGGPPSASHAILHIEAYGNATGVNLCKNAIRFNGGTGSGNMIYNETVRVLSGTSTRYIPLSTEQGTYTTAYPIVTTYSGTAYAQTSTLAGGAADNAMEMTITDSTAFASTAYSRGLYINYTNTGIKSAGGEANGIGVDMDTSANVVQLYGISLYTGACNGATVNRVAGLYVYVDEDTGTVSRASCLHLETANTAAEYSDFISFRSHVDTVDSMLASRSGGQTATYFLHFETPTSAPVEAFNAAGNGDYSIKCFINGEVTYLHTYDAP